MLLFIYSYWISFLHPELDFESVQIGMIFREIFILDLTYTPFEGGLKQ